MAEEEKTKLEFSEPPVVKKRTGFEIFKDHLKAIGNYLWEDILEPALKDTASNMAKSAVDMALYGETRNDNRRDTGRTNYNRLSTSYYRSDSRRDRRDDYERDRDRYRTDRDMDNIIFSNRGDAEKLLDYLNDQINQYGQVYMADLYTELGVDSGFTDYNRGWETLRDAYIERARGGYRVVLPRPVILR